MNLFESVIDQTLKHYSPYVFDDPKSDKPKIKSRIKNKIIEDVKKISKKISVVEVFIKGSILTKQYTKDADIDIFVRVSANLYTDEQLSILLHPIWEEIDDTYLEGVPHPFQYYITSQKYNFENTEAAYDVINDDWLKKTTSKNINIDEYFDDFKKYVQQFSDFSEELRRSMIDYDILKEIPQDQLSGLQSKLDKELADINKSIDDLAEVYSDIKDFRNSAFADDMTPSEIKKYGIKTRLPGNVVFKLIERYQYLDLYRKIKKIIGNDNKLSHDEAEHLNDLLKTKLTKENTSFKKLFESPDYTPEGDDELDDPRYNKIEFKYVLEGNEYKLDHSFNISGEEYDLYIKKEYGETVFKVINENAGLVVAQVIWSKEEGRLNQTSLWRHNSFRGFMDLYLKKILPRIKGKTLFSDDSQTDKGFGFWKRLFEKFHNKTYCGIYDTDTDTYKKYTPGVRMEDYFGVGKYRYLYVIKVPNNLLSESDLSLMNPFKTIKGRGDLQHKPRHRQQQADAGMKGHGTRKSLKLMPDYQRKTSIKTDRGIENVKKTTRVMRVKIGSPQARELAKKYRIDNPVGKKVVAANEYDKGVTIIFE